MRTVKTIVIGAGPSGLSAAYHLDGGGDTAVLESRGGPGGLCRSFQMNGAVFDVGGHSFHTTYDNVQSFVRDDMGIDLFFQKRIAMILFRNTMIPYPWQKFFHLAKDPQIVRECHSGLQTRHQYGRPGNLKDFILAAYGDGIAKHFLFPYNNKLWRHNLDDISCAWATERIASSGQNAADEKNRSAQRKPLDENSSVGYPPAGGFDEIFRAMAKKIGNIQFEQHVCFIDPAAKILKTRRGDMFRWDRIISTIPIPELMEMLHPVPEEKVGLAGRLPHVSLQVDYFVTKKPLTEIPQRLYSAEAEMPAHKIAFNSLSSQSEKQKPFNSIMTETSVRDYSQNACVERTERIIRGLANAGIIEGPSQILEHRCEVVKYAYPVQAHNVPGDVEILSRFLESMGIYTTGRFGQWRYVNSDQCLLMGAQIAKQIASKQDKIRDSAVSRSLS